MMNISRHTGLSQEFEQEGIQADVFFDADMYDSVVAAAFGGVRVNLDKNASMRVHPVWLLLCCMPLWMIQMSALMFLRLDQDLEQTVHLHKEHGKDTWQVSGNLLLTMQLMLIFIVQAVLFKEFLGPLRLLVFVMNPSTWTDIKRPNSLKMSGLNKIMFSSTSLAPLAIVAMLFKMSIAYQTTMDSVSIILACETAKDAIFDSLVITFIADLDVTMWNLCSMIFHLDDFDNFVMKTASHDFVRLARASVFMPAVHRWLRCLRRAEQGRKIESFLAFAIAFVFYARQLTVVLFALDTNVLPSARDVCTLYRWDTGNEETPFMSFGFHVVLRHMLVMDMHKRLVEVGDICQEESFDRMRLPDVKRILGDYPSICVGGMSILLTIFIAPQLIYFVTNRLSDLAKGFSEDEEEEEQENHGLKKQLDRLRRDVDWLLGKRCSSYPYLSSALSPLGVADARAP